MGRPRLPDNIKQLHGESRPSRRNPSEPRPRSTRPRMPTDLSPAARAVWRRVVLEMEPTGVITAADTDVLRSYCEAVARYVYAAKMLEQTGPLIKGGRGAELVKNPLHQVVRDNAVLVRMLARELGLTPGARANLRGAPEIADQDPFSAFLDGTSG